MLHLPTDGPGAVAGGAAVCLYVVAQAIKVGGPELRKWVELLRDDRRRD